MSDDIKLPELPITYYHLEYGKCAYEPSSTAPRDGYSKEEMLAFARAAVLADRAERASAAEQVCYEAYQVVGSMLEDLGQFGSGRSWKVLDNLNQAKKVHDDVLPWPSFKADGRKPLTSDQCDDIFDRVACEGPDGFECDWMDVIRATERAHDIVEKESGNG